MDTYRSQAEADADCEQLERLHVALNASKASLRLDACRLWTIRGRIGGDGIARNYISTWGDGETWLLYLCCRSPQAWTWAKKRLAFAEITQDGDDEGVLRLHRLPTAAEAAVIRDILGIRQTREVAPDAALRFGPDKRPENGE